jgi:hypothetical protein
MRFRRWLMVALQLFGRDVRCRDDSCCFSALLSYPGKFLPSHGKGEFISSGSQRRAGTEYPDDLEFSAEDLRVNKPETWESSRMASVLCLLPLSTM